MENVFDIASRCELLTCLSCAGTTEHLAANYFNILFNFLTDACKKGSDDGTYLELTTYLNNTVGNNEGNSVFSKMYTAQGSHICQCIIYLKPRRHYCHAYLVIY